MSDEEKEQQEELVTDTVTTVVNADTVRRYGAGVKEHFVAYSGQDNETGQTMKRSLKSISKQRVNSEYEYQNTKQKAGYAAETKTVARENAEREVNGDTSSRTTRTDDMQKQSDGQGSTIGGTNEQHYDVATVDNNGTYVSGSGRQLKFVGSSPDECAKKLMSKDYDKYEGATLEVPSDYYEGVMKNLNKRAEALERQIENAEAKGNTALAEKHRAQLERVKQRQKSLKKGKVSSKEAIEAATNAELSTAKDICNLALRSGVEAAKSGAAIASGVSLIRNFVALIRGEKDVDEAALNVIGDTAMGAGTAFATTSLATVLKGAMQNSGNELMRSLAASESLPGQIVNAVVQTGKTLGRFATGEIDGTECVIELGNSGANIVAGGYFGAVGATIGASIGTLAIPIPIIGTTIGELVGGMIGSFVGCVLASSYYQKLVDALTFSKAEKEEMMRITAELEAAAQAQREYRAEMEVWLDGYFREYKACFTEALSVMETAFAMGDAEGVICGANMVTAKLGGQVEYETVDGFQDFFFSTAVDVL